jgi:TldD protein
MLDVLTDVVGTIPADCAYAEARHVAEESEDLAVVNGRVERIATQASEGIGVRVLVGGGWGFAATRDTTRAGARKALARALAIARAQPTGPARALAPVSPASGHWEGPCQRDPAAVGLEDKLALLVSAEEALRGDPRIARTVAECHWVRSRKAFASSEGAACTQEATRSGAGLTAAAVDESELQTRSYPAGHGGSIAAAGWEHVTGLDLPGQAPRVAEEVVALLTAPRCPAVTTTLVLDSEQVALQIHESIGHALELDRMLLGEASYAGTSWVSPQDLGTLRYGSPLLNVVADATTPGGLGSFGWDDEGVAPGSYPLIEEGLLRGALSDRASAAVIGLARSGGCARADGFDRQPIVRMTNVSLEPGEDGTLEDLVAATDDGIYMETNRSWSIDDRRLQFQFATEVGREIKNGKLGRLVRNPSYAGITPTFWGSLDAVGSPPAWELRGLTNCGKGEPGQIMAVSHGAAPARFRSVQVGVA